MSQSTQTNHLKKTHALLQSWHDLQQAQPNIRIRHAASQLKVSEAELLATQCGKTVTRLKPDWPGILYNLYLLGNVMLLTRNDVAVHEKKTVCKSVSIVFNQASLVTDTLELRLMLEHLCFAFAVQENTARRQRFSLQFFDAAGNAVHKIYLTDHSNRHAFDAITDTFRHADQREIITTQDALNDNTNSYENVSIDEFSHYWHNLKKPQDFETMLAHFKISRFTAISLAGQKFIRPVDASVFPEFIKIVIEIALPVRLRVQNTGAIQIHKGVLYHLKPTGPWLNILDDTFNLHLLQESIYRMYIVEKPFATRKVTTLELYDATGQEVLIMSGINNFGVNEDLRWLDLVQSLPATKEVA